MTDDTARLDGRSESGWRADNGQGKRVLAGVGSKAGDPSVGFNPVETLLSAVGACMTSSLGLVADNSDVVLEDVAVSSPATDDKLDRIVDIAHRSSTVVSTLEEAMDLNVTWKRL